MRNDYQYIKFEQEVRRRLEPAVLHELVEEVRHQLVDTYPQLPLTTKELNHVIALTSWVASEAYWRGYDRLAPPDF